MFGQCYKQGNAQQHDQNIFIKKYSKLTIQPKIIITSANITDVSELIFYLSEFNNKYIIIKPQSIEILET